MKMWRRLVLTIGIIFCGCGYPNHSPVKDIAPQSKKSSQKPRPITAAEKQAKAKLIGKWRQLSSVKQQPDFGANGLWAVTIDDKKLHMNRRGGQFRFDFSFRLDPSRMPPAIDLVLESFVVDDYFKQPKSPHFGIYKLDAMTKILTLRVSPTKRPKDFVRKHDSPSKVLPGRDWLIVLERNSGK